VEKPWRGGGAGELLGGTGGWVAGGRGAAGGWDGVKSGFIFPIRPGYVGFFQFLRNFRQLNAFEQAELILQATLDPTIARRAKKGEFVKCFDHFDLLQTAIN
jgi:hypothetical protein